MQTIHTEIPVNAPPESVWKGLVESPAIPMKIGMPYATGKIGLNLSVPMRSGNRSVTLIVKVLAVDPPAHIWWKEP